MKYTYQGMSIKEYCEKNNIYLQDIYVRIYRLKAKNPNLTNEELVKLAIEKPYGFKYVYQGISLTEYCRQNNISRKYIYKKIERLRKKNPNLTNEELIKLAMAKTSRFKYMYQGISLKEYCEKKEISIQNIYSKIFQLRKKNTALTDDELVRLAIENLSKPQYIYEGMSIRKYCKQNNIPSNTIYTRIHKIKKTNSNLTPDEILKIAFKDQNKYKYTFQGISLAEYCKQNNLSYQYIYKRIQNLKKENPNLSQEEIIEKALNLDLNIRAKRSSHYLYLGIPLKVFCDHNEIKYNSIISYLSNLSKNYNYSNEEINAYLIERRFRINGKVLKDYCESINFPYDTMHEILKKEMKKNPDTKFKTILLSTITTINQYRLTNYSKINNFNQEINEYLNSCTSTYLRSSYNLKKIR